MRFHAGIRSHVDGTTGNPVRFREIEDDREESGQWWVAAGREWGTWTGRRRLAVLPDADTLQYGHRGAHRGSNRGEMIEQVGEAHRRRVMVRGGGVRIMQADSDVTGSLQGTHDHGNARRAAFEPRMGLHWQQQLHEKQHRQAMSEAAGEPVLSESGEHRGKSTLPSEIRSSAENDPDQSRCIARGRPCSSSATYTSVALATRSWSSMSWLR